MPLDPKAKRILDIISVGAAFSTAPPTIAERRDNFRKLMRMATGPVTPCAVEERTVSGACGALAARLYSPPNASGLLPGLVFFHGGGLVAGGLDTHDGLCRLLAIAAASRIVSVDYRLAPEHPFPAAVEDACTAVAWIAEHAHEFDIDRERLGVGGDSGGGTLAAIVCQWARGRAAPRIAVQLLLCPVLDFFEASASRRAFARGYLLDQETMARDLAYYLDGATLLNDPRISPLRAKDFTGLPPALIHTAEFDPLRDEGIAYFDALTKAGVWAQHTCHLGMIHHFYAMGRILPEAELAVRGIGIQLQSALAGSR